MGVKGLWQLLDSVGRPVSLESLENKVLAVDTSIWLHQAISGVRDKSGNPLPNAHLLTLFSRICKLLLYKIKPVFVFDGSVPQLKKKTLKLRRERRENATDDSKKMHEKIIKNLMQSHAIKTRLDPNAKNSNELALPSSSTKPPDMFELPPLPQDITNNEYDDETSSSDAFDMLQERRQYLNSLNTESDDFKALPPEIQHELLTEMKESQKRHSWAKIDQLPTDLNDFSSFQMQALLKKRELQKKIENAQKAMEIRQTSLLSGEVFDGHFAESRRIISEDNAHYLLVKKNKVASPISIDEKPEEVHLINDEMKDVNFQPHVESNTSNHNCGTVVKKVTEDIVSVQEIDPVAITRDLVLNLPELATVDVSESSTSNDEEEMKSQFSVEPEAAKTNLNAHGSVKIIEEYKKPTEEKSVTEITVEDEKMEVVKVPSVASSDDDNDFIEVVVNPATVVHDELFPAEIFETDEMKEDNVLESVAGSSMSVEKDEIKPMEPLDSVQLEELQKQLSTETETLIAESGKRERMAQTLTEQMCFESQELLRLFGIPFVVSPTEAEAQCAKLDQLDLTEGTITDDSDVWLFGGRRVYKNFYSQRRDVEFYAEIDLKKLALNRSKLIALSLLTGSDYTEGIKGVGIVTAMEILAEFPKDDGIESLQLLRNWWDKRQKMKKPPTSETRVKEKLVGISLSEGFPSSVVVEAYLSPTVDESSQQFSWAIPDLDSLRQFANVKFGWTRNKIDAMLLPVIKRMNEPRSQATLDRYFPAASQVHSNVRSPSKRLGRAIARVASAGSSNRERGIKRNRTTRPKRRCMVLKSVNLSESSESS